MNTLKRQQRTDWKQNEAKITKKYPKLFER